GPHDRLAALLHRGRAIGDAPGSRYPVERLAALALETATHPALDPRLAAAAARALSRAADDAPMHVELVEALAALQLRFGHPDEAERRLNAAIALGPNRAQLYALLSQALRAQGRLESALAALEPPGVDAARGDPMLWTERGMVLAARGDLVGAAAAWKQVLARDPVHPAAFASLATLALRMGDATGAHALTDAALVASAAHPDVLRRAVQLALATESEGIARASRVAQLCTRLLEVSPGDAWAALTLARALLSLGDVAGARLRLAEVDRIGPGSAAAADAQVVRLAIDDPATEEELRSALRAAHRAEPHALGDVAARARRLATLHSAWPGWLAAAVAERRKHRWAAARSALELALELAPGSAAAHVELAEVLLALADSRGAMTHARRALSLEGESPRALLALSRALSASGEAEEARRVARRALAIKPQDEEARALAVALPVARRERGWRDRLRSLWRATTRSG
ncbi:MAG: tetratricopeptide repeat protein, partial [Myxococcales bacterium]|nr:tetratricopeptide repeat protein [Myxococcales bacterium]